MRQQFPWLTVGGPDVDRDVEWNVTEEGGPLSQRGWGPWTQLPGGGLTTDTPNEVRFGGNLHVFVRGTDKSVRFTAHANFVQRTSNSTTTGCVFHIA